MRFSQRSKSTWDVPLMANARAAHRSGRFTAVPFSAKMCSFNKRFFLTLPFRVSTIHFRAASPRTETSPPNIHTCNTFAGRKKHCVSQTHYNRSLSPRNIKKKSEIEGLEMRQEHTKREGTKSRTHLTSGNARHCLGLLQEAGRAERPPRRRKLPLPVPSLNLSDLASLPGEKERESGRER
jgi:hypothetical protein